MASVPGNDFNGWRKPISKLSPFAIHMVVKGIEVHYLTCSKESQSDNLLRCVLFGGVASLL